MATLQAQNLFLSSSSSSPSGHRRVRASLHLPANLRTNGVSLPKLNLGGLSLRQDDTATSFTQPPRPTTASEDEHLVSKIHAILDAVVDRAEMHAIIGAQRNDWNHLFTNSINAISLTASLMAGISSIPVGEAAPHVLAFKLSSVILFTAATGMMLITSKIQPSQLAEEQRNATRLWEQLGRSIETTLALRAPTQRDIDEAMEKVLALDKAYPLPLLPGMLEKFPEIVEPTRWWPKIQPKPSPLEGRNAAVTGEVKRTPIDPKELLRDGGFVVPDANSFGHTFRDYNAESEWQKTVEDKYDLYSKSKVRIDVEKVKPYYLSVNEKGVSLPKLNLGGLSLRQDDTATSFTQPPRPTTASEDEHLVSKIHAILDAVADRAEMHAIIGAQRNDWNHLFTNSINAISLTASLMAGISSIPVGEAAPHMLAFKLSSVILFTAATGMMLITSKIQPSQLAEEQRNATRLWEQLGRSIETTLALRAPTQRDVDEAMEKVLALDKAYPLPLLPGMLEKFPEIVEPTRWWPKIQPKQSPQAGGNGWSHELEGEMRGILRVLKAKDEQQYTTLGKLLLNMNKTLAISGPLLAGLAAISSGLIGSPALGPMPAFLGVIGGVLATAVHTLEHGGQVGMVFELFRNCAGYYRRLQEEIASNLGETDVQKRENGELFEMKVALQLGRSLSDLKGLASYASPLCEDEDIKEFAGKLF
ncbi:F-box protein [Musa troglodytarum]|uniref:F-box protein n=1 Tax=Musa troglodytarum TaxID=320322 RepID=A0A9E7KDU1_9LILI|nr:F-box protein [Musa troglodytarum]